MRRHALPTAIATFEFSDLAFTEDVVVRALAVEDSINNYSPPLDQKCLGDEQASVRLVGRENGTPINGRFYVMFE